MLFAILMALSFAHGAVQWLAADAATTVYTISGLTFQPTALRFYWQGLQSAADATGNTSHSRRGIGFAVGTSSRRCVATQNQDNVPDAVCTSGHFTDCVAATVTSTPARDGALDLNAITSDGFTLIVDDQAPVNITVFWEAWGGCEAFVGDITEPAATGEQDYSVPGFHVGMTDQVILLAGVQQTAADTVSRLDDGLCIGAIADEGLPWVLVNNGVDAAATMTNSRYGLDQECLAMIAVGGTNPDARAEFTQFTTGGFRLNWLARAVTNRRYVFLAMKGGIWQTGQHLVGTGSVGNTDTTTTAFEPIGISIVRTDAGEPSTPGIGNTGDQLLIMGTASSPSSRRGMFTLIPDQATSNVDLEISYDQLGPYAVFGLNSDLDAFLSNGFRTVWDGPSTEGNSHWHAYVTFGNVVRRFLLVR